MTEEDIQEYMLKHDVDRATAIRQLLEDMDCYFKAEKEVYNAFGLPLEVFEEGSPNKASAEIQLKQFLELNKTIKRRE